MRAHHPRVSLWVHYCSATIAPKHVHYLALGCCSETHSLGDYFVDVFHVEKQARWRSANGLSDALTSAGFSGPSIKVVPRNVNSAWMGLPSGPFMMPRLEKPRVPARGPHADSANSAASRLIKNHSSNHDARYNDFARRGYKRAVVAIAHKILVAIYHMLSQQVSYNDLGDLYLDKLNKNHLTRNLVHRLERLGYAVTLTLQQKAA